MNFTPVWFSCYFCKKLLQCKSTLILHMKEEHAQVIEARKRQLNGIEDENFCHEGVPSEAGGFLKVEKVVSTSFKETEAVPRRIRSTSHTNDDDTLKGSESVTFWASSPEMPTEVIDLSGESDEEGRADGVVGHHQLLPKETFICKNCPNAFSNLASLVLHVKSCHAERPQGIPHSPLVKVSPLRESELSRETQLDQFDSIDAQQISRRREEHQVLNGLTMPTNISTPGEINFNSNSENGQSDLDNVWKTKRDKIFRCDLCDKSYGWRQSLATHKRNVHPTRRPETSSAWMMDYELEEPRLVSQGYPMDLASHAVTQIPVEVQYGNDNYNELDIEEFVAVYCRICNKNFLTLDRLDEHTKMCELNRDLALRACHWTSQLQLAPPFPVVNLVDPYNYESEPERSRLDKFRPIFPKKSLLHDQLTEANAQMVIPDTSTPNFDVAFRIRRKQPSIHKCDSCDKSFTTLVYLNKHKSLHSSSCSQSERRGSHDGKQKLSDDPKPFMCTNCGRGFARKCSLVLHSQVHGSFWCDLCQVTFKYSSHLDEHMEKIHSPHFPSLYGNTSTHFSELFKLLQSPSRYSF